jgi:hypothetical protein
LFSEGKKKLPSAFMILKIKKTLLQDKEGLLIILDNFDQMKNFGRLLWNIFELMQNIAKVGYTNFNKRTEYTQHRRKIIF